MRVDFWSVARPWGSRLEGVKGLKGVERMRGRRLYHLDQNLPSPNSLLKKGAARSCVRLESWWEICESLGAGGFINGLR